MHKDKPKRKKGFHFYISRFEIGEKGVDFRMGILFLDPDMLFIP